MARQPMLLVHSSCAELESTLNEAAVYAAYDRSSTISAAHFIRAVLTTVHHVSPDISDADEEDRAASARHEAGHIAVMELLAPDSVAFETLCSKRPRDCSGFILRNSRLDMETSVMTLLAGKSACELYYGKVAIGCGDDLSKAIAQIRRWVETLSSNGILGANVFGRYDGSDIHGCDKKYFRLLEMLHFNGNDTLYILGDVTDRGSGDLRVLLDAASRQNVILLRGNHEQTALEFLPRDPDTFDAFLELLRQDGYIVKPGKHPALCKEGQKAIRLDSLKDGYTEDDIRAVIAGQKQHRPRKKKDISLSENIQRIIDLEAQG